MRSSLPSIDQVRDYWNAQPCNVHHSDAPLGTEEYFRQVSWKKYWVEPHILTFADFKSWQGKSVLEIGCGIGTDAESFAKAGAIYTGLDISDKSLDLAKERFRVLGLSGTFVLGNAEELCRLIPPQSFDLVYSFGALHHTRKPEQVVTQVLLYLEPESEFRLMLYAKDSWKDIMIGAGLDQPEAQSGCPIANRFTKAEARSLLHHYDIISMEQAHIFPYSIPEYTEHHYRLEPWFQAMPTAMFQALEKRLGWHLLIRTRKKCITCA